MSNIPHLETLILWNCDRLVHVCESIGDLTSLARLVEKLQNSQCFSLKHVGDDELTKGRSLCVQMLYEFDIMSTSLQDVKDPNMKPEYVSEVLHSSTQHNSTQKVLVKRILTQYISSSQHNNTQQVFVKRSLTQENEETIFFAHLVFVKMPTLYSFKMGLNFFQE